MSTDSAVTPLAPASALSNIQKRSYLALLATCGLSVAAAVWLVPPLSFVFGVGWVAPTVAALLLFSVLMIFKSLIFKYVFTQYPISTEDSLRAFMAQKKAEHGNAPTEADQELLENALHLREVQAADCMAKRGQIVHISADAAPEDLRRLFVSSQLSRILVTEGGDLDQVLGYVHVQQLVQQPDAPHLRDWVLPIDFVDTQMPVNHLLSRFVRRRTNIACVTDAEGRLAGIITLEDILEQLFGAIDDEHDE
jgi:CBS domain containing-hemolysin-like protein